MRMLRLLLLLFELVSLRSIPTRTGHNVTERKEVNDDFFSMTTFSLQPPAGSASRTGAAPPASGPRRGPRLAKARDRPCESASAARSCLSLSSARGHGEVSLPLLPSPSPFDSLPLLLAAAAAAASSTSSLASITSISSSGSPKTSRLPPIAPSSSLSGLVPSSRNRALASGQRSSATAALTAADALRRRQGSPGSRSEGRSGGAAMMLVRVQLRLQGAVGGLQGLWVDVEGAREAQERKRVGREAARRRRRGRKHEARKGKLSASPPPKTSSRGCTALQDPQTSEGLAVPALLAAGPARRCVRCWSCRRRRRRRGGLRSREEEEANDLDFALPDPQSFRWASTLLPRVEASAPLATRQGETAAMAAPALLLQLAGADAARRDSTPSSRRRMETNFFVQISYLPLALTSFSLFGVVVLWFFLFHLFFNRHGRPQRRRLLPQGDVRQADRARVHQGRRVQGVFRRELGVSCKVMRVMVSFWFWPPMRREKRVFHFR